VRRLGAPGLPSADPGRVGAGHWGLLTLAVAACLLCDIWRFQDLFPVLGLLQVPLLSSVAAIVVLVLSRDVGRSLAVWRHPMIKLGLVILLLMVVSVPGSLYPGLSARFILKDHVRTFLLMVILAGSVRVVGDLERFAAVQVMGAAIFCIMVLVKFPVGADGRLGELGYYDANDMGMILVCAIPLATYFLRSGVRPTGKWLALAALGIFVVGVIKTGSRGGFLALIVTSAFIVFRFTALPRRIRITAVAAAFLVLALASNDRYWTTMHTLLNPRSDYNWAGHEEGGRMEVWKRGVGYMADHPLLGVGVSAFPIAEGTISPLAERQQVGRGLKWSAAHNSFVQVGAELGIPGLLVFVWLLWSGAKTLRRIGRLPRGPDGRTVPSAALAQSLAASLVGYCTAGFFLSQAYSAFLYSVLGMIVGLAVVAPTVSAPVRGRVGWSPRWGPPLARPTAGP
jgi:O-antigen ligase